VFLLYRWAIHNRFFNFEDKFKQTPDREDDNIINWLTTFVINFSKCKYFKLFVGKLQRIILLVSNRKKLQNFQMQTFYRAEQQTDVIPFKNHFAWKFSWEFSEINHL
jgi:hypothetical protein